MHIVHRSTLSPSHACDDRHMLTTGRCIWHIYTDCADVCAHDGMHHARPGLQYPMQVRIFSSTSRPWRTNFVSQPRPRRLRVSADSCGHLPFLDVYTHTCRHYKTQRATAQLRQHSVCLRNASWVRMPCIREYAQFEASSKTPCSRTDCAPCMWPLRHKKRASRT